MPWSFDASYPGVNSFYSVRYLTSLGISPGFISVQCHPGSNPALGGTFIFGVTDGATTNTLTLPDCLLDGVSFSATDHERVMILQFKDRRWKWLDRYPCEGHWNMLDKHRKLVPSSVRSPFQMATYLLSLMGEPTPPGGWESKIDLPAGLASATDASLKIPAPATFDQLVDAKADFLKCGVNFTRSRTNPNTVWPPGTPAAVALAQLCGKFGRAVALDPLTNTVSICKLGTGTSLPPGRQLQYSPALGLESVPSAITVVGAPIRWQVRLVFRAVGLDWETDWKPLYELSYAPPLPGPGQAMILLAKIVSFFAVDYTVFVNNVSFTSVAGTHPTANDAIANLATAINASTDPRVSGKVSAAIWAHTGLDNRLQLTGNITPIVGDEISLRTDDPTLWSLTCPQGPIPSPSVRRHRQDVTVTDPNFTFISGVATITVTVAGVAFTSDPTHAIGTAAIGISSSLDQIANLINLDPVVSLRAKATAQGRILAVDGIVPGDAIPISASVSGGSGVAVVSVLQSPVSKAYGFHFSGPEKHAAVQATDRLGFVAAQALANKSVFSCYQLVTENPADGADKTIPLPVPLGNAKQWRIDFTDLGFSFLALSGVLRVVIDGTIMTSTSGLAIVAAIQDLAASINAISPTLGFATAEGFSLYLQAPATSSTVVASVAPVEAGTAFATKTAPLSVSRRQLITLLDSRVEQIQPRAGDVDVIDPRTFQEFAFDTYQGYSADRRSTAFVSCMQDGNIFYKVVGGIGPNTPEGRELFLKFDTVDQERQVISFVNPVRRMMGTPNASNPTACVNLPALVIIETGILVSDPTTLMPYRYSVTVPIPGATAPPVVRVFDDVCQELIGIYDSLHRLVDVRSNDADAEQRAKIYASESALKYQFPASQTIVYNNLIPLPIDGKIRQVAWSFSREGFTTTGSENTEFSREIQPFGDRRRAENLHADARAVEQNLLMHPFLKDTPLNALDAAFKAYRGLTSD